MVYRGNGFLLELPQVAQQVLERQPGKITLVSTCANERLVSVTLVNDRAGGQAGF